MDGSTREDKIRLGAEIRRVRERRPKISRQRVADEAEIAEGTVRAAERGASTDHSRQQVLAALARLGRQVDVDAIIPSKPEPPYGGQRGSGEGGPRGGSTEGLSQIDLTVRLVESTLKASPPDERRALSGNIWLLVRGRNAELVERLRATSNGPASADETGSENTPPD